ncbi:MAG: AAA family ATPase [Rhodobacteraceae bacterium]|nr:AAA family ATPase [Paracoccaceae bacterium]
MVRTDRAADEALMQAFDALRDLHARGAKSLTFGGCLNILFSALSMVRPNEAVPVTITRINEAWEKLTGEILFVKSTADMASDYHRFANVYAELFDIMRDDWQWQPQDWLDIQWFLWIAFDKTLEPVTSSDTNENREAQMPIRPVNLILYGPPGTGKTFSTAAEAVRLCGEPEHKDRETLMQVYQQLLSSGRIEFVTFHQSMSYEDFVEGRQPMTGSDDGEDTSSAGFRLDTVPGIFRRIAKRAETSRGRSIGGDTVTVANRQVFKMSIGEASNPEDAPLFEEAIEGGYTLLGWEDIDWSDDKYANREAIIEACKTKGRIEGHTDVNALSGSVQMPFIFRNLVRKGDVVVVSKGNSLFRAIGEFTGDYEFHPRSEGGYAHRRAMRWLWVDRQGVSITEIYTRRFSMKALYMLHDSELNVPALERYLNSQLIDGPPEPESFVLIIDEINRANISKVFGELITLIEPDKRLGQPNALKIRLPYSGDDFGVPSNLHILGTMNTADRSIALLDTALRRRFTFQEMMPNPSLLIDSAEACGLNLPRILAVINERVEYLYDREHQIGHAYFIDCKSRADLDAAMRKKVIPLLAEYFFEDWDKIAAVLGDAASHSGSIKGGFLNRSVLKPPNGLNDDYALPRFRWEIRSEDEGFDYNGLTEA